MSFESGIPIEAGFTNYSDKPVDLKYGPWADVAAAVAGIAAPYRFKGLTVGITTGTAIVEYWWRDNTTDEGLIVKSGAANPGTGGGTISQYFFSPLTDGQTVIDLSEPLPDVTVTDVFLNGLLQVPGIDYSFSEGELTWLDDDLELKTWHMFIIKYIENEV